MKLCLCCNGRGNFEDKGKAKTPWEFPEPCIVCNGKGKLPDYTLQTKQNQMPVIKKTTTAPKSTAPKFAEGDEVLLLDEGEEKRGTILEIDVKKKTAVIQVGEDQYEESLNDIKPAPPIEEEEVEDPNPRATAKKAVKKVAPKAGSLSALLKKAEPAPDGGGGFPQGNWEAIIVGAGTKTGKDGSNLGYFEIVGVGDDDVEGKKATISSILQNADGSEGAGLGYFKRDCAKVGVDLDSIDSDDDLEIALQTLGEEEPWIEITAKPQKSNPQYMNIFLNGMKENQEDKPETPAY